MYQSNVQKLTGQDTGLAAGTAVFIIEEQVGIANMADSLAAIKKLFLSPHSHIPSRIGIRDLPRSVRLYSAFGGIWEYSFLCTDWSASNSFKVELSVLKEMSPIYYFISLESSLRRNAYFS